MSYSLTILMPNGRRQRVTTRLNTPILQVIEDVCEKQKFNPDKYDLKYHNRVLDISSTLQFCGVTNNAQLELVPLQKARQQNPVEVFLQLENSGRLSGTFIPSDTLWEVIIGLCSEETVSKENPVIIFMRQEVHGEKLRTTSLKMLGLTGGSALLRLLHRTPEQLSRQSVAPPSEKKCKKPKVEAKKESSSFLNRMITKIEEKMSIDVAEEPKSKGEQKPKNEIKPTNEPKRINEAKKSEDVSQKQGVINKNFQMTPQIEKNDKKISKVEEKMDTDDESVVTSSIGSISNLSSNVSSPCIDVDQSYIDSLEYIGDRNALIYVLDEVFKTPKYLEPTDEFFEVTVDDAKVLMRDVKQMRSQIEDIALSTETMREQKHVSRMEKILSRYPHCIVRILFPNRIVLQGIFNSTETISEVTQFTRKFLHNSELEFFLYTSPPRTVLKPNDRLVNLGIPGLLVYFGASQDSKNSGKLPQYLRSDIIQQTVSPDVATRVAIFFRKRPQANCSNSVTPSVPTASTSSSCAGTSTNKSFTTENRQPSSSYKSNKSGPQPDSKQDKVPKWFKKMF